MRGDAGIKSEETPSLAASPPLVTDLDGTLLATDSLWEGAIAAVRGNPACIASLLAGLAKGRAAFQSEVAKRGALDVAALPWRADVLEYLRSERSEGRRIVLATAAHRSVAEQASRHLDLFDEVLSSTDTVNLKGVVKRDALVRRFGFKGFDYLGGNRSDRPVRQACRIARAAGVAQPAAGFRKWARAESFRSPARWPSALL